MAMQLYLNIIMVEKYFINECIFKKNLKCWPVRLKLSPDLHNYKYVTNRLQNYLNNSNLT